MSNQTAKNFIESFYNDVVEAMDEADKPPVDTQYRLGVRRIAWAFFQKVELFGIEDVVPSLAVRDVDAWFAGRETR